MTDSTAAFKLGITGGIATGKSVVGKILAELGIPVLDTDHVVHQLLANDKELVRAIVAHFGADILDENGQLVRKRLGAKVFNHPDERKQLEGMIHPRVRMETEQFLNEPLNQPDERPYGFIRATLVPLLFEAGSEGLYDEVWTVTAPEAVQRARLMARDGMDEAEATRRISAHWPQERKAALSQRIIVNDGNMEQTREQVMHGLEEIRQRWDSPL
jgi:dephospho-CoA kinase